jgi:hypothetical protein
MKKVKWTLMSLAVLVSVGGAFASRLHNQGPCTGDTQYYYAGGGAYVNAGKLGTNYLCDSGSGTCTYYTTDNIHYYSCESGLYCTANCLTGGNPKPVKPAKEVPSPEHSAQ